MEPTEKPQALSIFDALSVLEVWCYSQKGPPRSSLEHKQTLPGVESSPHTSESLPVGPLNLQCQWHKQHTVPHQEVGRVGLFPMQNFVPSSPATWCQHSILPWPGRKRWSHLDILMKRQMINHPKIFHQYPSWHILKGATFSSCFTTGFAEPSQTFKDNPAQPNHCYFCKKSHLIIMECRIFYLNVFFGICRESLNSLTVLLPIGHPL